MGMSINQLSELTGKDRRTITSRCKDVPLEKGAKGAHLYDPKLALPAIYAAGGDGTTLDEARKRQALSQAQLNELRCEEVRRERIPIDIVRAIWDAALQAFTPILKAARGKTLTLEKINELIEALRSAKLPLKW